MRIRASLFLAGLTVPLLVGPVFGAARIPQFRMALLHECPFGGYYYRLPDHAHCVTEFPVAAWLCDDGYVEARGGCVVKRTADVQLKPVAEKREQIPSLPPTNAPAEKDAAADIHEEPKEAPAQLPFRPADTVSTSVPSEADIAVVETLPNEPDPSDYVAIDDDPTPPGGDEGPIPDGVGFDSSSSGAAASASTVITADQASSKAGKWVTVRYFVAHPFTSSRGDIFLDEKSDYNNGFVAVIFASDASAFGPDPAGTYGNRTIDVTGTVDMYMGHPEIIVSSPSQISTVK